jgi:hypothetical protein
MILLLEEAARCAALDTAAGSLLHEGGGEGLGRGVVALISLPVLFCPGLFSSGGGSGCKSG